MPKIPCPIDPNFVMVSALAAEINKTPAVINNWIRRDLINYMELPMRTTHRYLVDRRTVPATSPSNAGRKRK